MDFVKRSSSAAQMKLANTFAYTLSSEHKMNVLKKYKYNLQK